MPLEQSLMGKTTDGLCVDLLEEGSDSTGSPDLKGMCGVLPSGFKIPRVVVRHPQGSAGSYD
jgi:hypothetical protein